MKNIIWIFAVILIVCSFISCKSNNDSNKTAPGSSSSTPAPTPPPSEPTPGDGGTCSAGVTYLNGASDFDSEWSVAELEFCDSWQLRVDIPSEDGADATEYIVALANAGDTAESYMVTNVDDDTDPRVSFFQSIYSRKNDKTGKKLENKSFNQHIDVLERANKKIKKGVKFYRTAIDREQAQNVGDKARFRVRNKIDDPTSVAVITATLKYISAAQRVRIFVDDAVLPADLADVGVPTYSTIFTNLAYIFGDTGYDVVGTGRKNIYDKIEDLYGTVSDVNSDNTVSILITPRMNMIFRTNDIIDDDGLFLKFQWADPSDLLVYDAQSNPVSNEQEIIYLPAPDSSQSGIPPFNPDHTLTRSGYITPRLLGGITYQLAILADYYQRVEVHSYDAEDPVINSGLEKFNRNTQSE